MSDQHEISNSEKTNDSGNSASLEPSDASNNGRKGSMDPQGTLSRSFLHLLRASFFFSGGAALVYEIAWQRVLVRLVGVTTPAVSAIVCAFMGGLLFGSLLGSRLAGRARSTRDLANMLALVEVLTGIAGVISVNICRTSVLESANAFLSSCTAGNGTLLAVSSGIAAFLLILIPTTLMGTTIPLMAALSATCQMNRDEREPDRSLIAKAAIALGFGNLIWRRFGIDELGLLYAFNTSGAVIGALLAGLQFLPSVGISQTLYYAAAANAAASIFAALSALVAVPLAKKAETIVADTVNGAPGQASPYQTNFAIASAVVLICGSLSMTMEIVWTRFLVLVFGSSGYALCVVLSMFIAGMALGAWLIALLARRVDEKGALFSFLIATTAVLLGACMFQYQQLPAIYLNCKKFLLDFFEPGFLHDSVSMIIGSAWLVLPSATLMGTIFPLALGSLNEKNALAIDEGVLAKKAGRLYAINLIGCIFGSFCTGLFTLPAMGQYFPSGIEVTTILVACFYILLSFLVAFSVQQESTVTLRSLRNVIFLTGFAFALVILRPAWNTALMSSGVAFISSDDLRRFEVSNMIDILSQRPKGNTEPNQKMLFYREGANSTVAVASRDDANINFLKNNGKTEATIPINPSLPAPKSDLPTHTLLAIMPVALARQAVPTEALKGLVIGYGSGTTCGALLSSPRVQQVTAVEAEEAIWAADHYFQPTNGNPLQKQWLDSGRMIQVSLDARNFLSTRQEKFDFIISQAGEPALSGSADLYTEEFYGLARSRLHADGIFCQWLPLYAIDNQKLTILVDTFKSVFPNVSAWHAKRSGDLFLIGSFSQERPVSLAELKAIMDCPTVGNKLDSIGIDGPFTLAACMVFSSSGDAGGEKKAGATMPKAATLNTDDNLIIEFARDHELPPDELNVEVRLANLQNVFASKNQPGRQPGNPLERALALAYATRKRYESAPFSDSYYYCIMGGSPPDPKAPPDLVAPSGHTFSLSEEAAGLVEEEAVDKDLIQFRYWLHMGDGEKAIACFSGIPQPELMQLQTYDCLCDVATACMVRAEYRQAADYFQKALQKQPAGSRALAGKGLCQWLSGDDKNAEPLLARSLKLDPNQFLARYAYGQILYKAGREAEAKTNMRQASRVNPSSPLPGIFVTALFLSKGEYIIASDNLHLVMRRQRSLLPEAVALGFLIAGKTKRSPELLSSFARRYREMTGKEVTIESAQTTVAAILNKPFGIKSYSSGKISSKDQGY